MHELTRLNFKLDALTPYISQETIGFHYGKHHQAYVNNLNNLIGGTEFEKQTLEDIVKLSSGKIFNNAAQIWNHDFYWRCLSPDGGGEPREALAQAINHAFGSFSDFQKQFTESALSLFGSGWTWLVRSYNGDLKILNTANAETPFRDNHQCLITCDVWEHAYYVDYRNARAKYIEAFWKLVNWEFAESNFKVNQ